MNSNQVRALDKIKKKPAELGRRLGFSLLTDLHNEWIKMMTFGKSDVTLQAHRGSYKTTCVSISLMLIIILFPNERTAFLRKTDADVKEIIAQVKKMLRTEFVNELVRIIWGVDLMITVSNATEVSTNLTNDPRGISQLVGMGVGGSLTGKHFDRIFTDDIVNINDRISKAERDKTKLIYQELQNIKNERGRIVNTGTPWHKEDAFTLMPNVIKYDCYTTGLMSKEDIEYIRERMSPSLFSANYELKHIADDNVLFDDPEIIDASIETIKGGRAHLDAAFYGEDYTAFSIMQKHDNTYYLFGKCWHKHVEDCYSEIMKLYNDNLCSKLYNELNADKGYVAKDLRALGMKVVTYSESMNKHIKIATYLKAIWPNIVIVDGTDDEYLDMILDYTEDAEHDDAPDSAACLARLFYKPEKMNSNDIARPYLL